MSAEPWSGERDASRYGNMALQVDVTTQEVIGNEDCLYLNVFTTKIESFEKRPVMVWIHGGGFLVGSGDANWFGPDYIVQKDVILITLNYRLSVLGTSFIILMRISCILRAVVVFSNVFKGQEVENYTQFINQKTNRRKYLFYN